jgi:hypothetical protein
VCDGDGLVQLALLVEPPRCLAKFVGIWAQIQVCTCLCCKAHIGLTLCVGSLPHQLSVRGHEEFVTPVATPRQTCCA